MDTFLAESGRSEFSFRLLIATTDLIGRTAKRTIEAQEKQASVVLLGDLEAAKVDWPGRLQVLSENPLLVLDGAHNAASAQALRKALDLLPSRQREVVLLRDVEGLSSEEASDVLGIRPGNQRVLLHRGRAGLREMLTTQMGRA